MGQNERATSNAFPWKEILGFLGVALAAYIGYLGLRSQIEIPIQATQTAEAKLTSVAQIPVTSLQSNQIITETKECINSSLWNSLTGESIESNSCLPLDSWGIIAKENGFAISMNSTNKAIRQGIFTPISNGTQVQLKLTLSTLYTPYENNLANLSIGIISINTHDLETDTLLIYQKESPMDGYPIFLKTNERDGFGAYLTQDGNYRKYIEFTEQEIILDLSETNLLTIYIDGVQIIQHAIPFQDKAFWIGYRLPENGQINAEISELHFQTK